MKQVRLNDSVVSAVVQAYMNDAGHKVCGQDQQAIGKVVNEQIRRCVEGSSIPRKQGAPIIEALKFGQAVTTSDPVATKFFNAATVQVRKAVEVELAKIAEQQSLDSKKAARVVGALIRAKPADLPEHWDSAFGMSVGIKGGVRIIYDYEWFAGSSQTEHEHCAALETWLKAKLAANPKWAAFAKLNFEFYGPDAT